MVGSLYMSVLFFFQMHSFFMIFPETAADPVALTHTVIYSDLVTLFNQVVLVRGTWEQKHSQSDSQETKKASIKL